MLDRDILLEEVSALGLGERRTITDPDELSAGDDAFFITAGKALIRESTVLPSGLDSTQTFSIGDAIYLAAVLSKRPRDWEFTIHEPLEVIALNGDVLREAVMKSGFLVSEVIRNSVTRIFDIKHRENAAFEDRFIKRFKRVALSSTHRAGDCIYRIGDRAEGLYFIERGRVYLTTARNARFAELTETDFFGETSLLTSDRRSKNIYAETDCSVLLLDRKTVEAEVDAESPLVKLVLANILTVLELMNRLRFAHLNASSFHEAD